MNKRALLLAHLSSKERKDMVCRKAGGCNIIEYQEKRKDQHKKKQQTKNAMAMNCINFYQDLFMITYHSPEVYYPENSLPEK